MRALFRAKGFPFFLYLGSTFIAFFPCLVLGYAYFDNDLMNSYGHFRAFLKNQLLLGHFPLWDPYLMGGQPFFAHPCSMMCYPLTYLTLPFSIPYGLSLFFFLHMFWAAAGMHLWMKKFGLTQCACAAGALSFALSGFFWWELIHPNLLAVFAWFPWFLLCLEEWIQNFGTKWAFRSGLCFAIVFLCGHFQEATYVFYAGLIYFPFRFFTFNGKKNQSSNYVKSPKPILLFSFALWGVFPFLAPFIPTLEYFKNSIRDQKSISYDLKNGPGSMRPGSISQFVFPALGVPRNSTLEIEIQSFDNLREQENNFFGALGYIGIWAPLLMAFAYFQNQDKKFYWFLVTLCFGGVLSALGRHFPLHRLECAFLPGIGINRAPYRFLGFYVVFASALCSMGFEALEKKLEAHKTNRFWILTTGAYFLILLGISLKNPRQVWVEITALTLGLFSLLLWAQTLRWKKIGKISFLASIWLSLMGAGWSGYSLGPASNFDLEKNFPAFNYLKKNQEEGRYYFDSSLSYVVQSATSSFRCFFPEDAVMALGIRSAGDYGGFELQRAVDLRKIPMRTFLQIMAVRGLLFEHRISAPNGYLNFSFGDIQLYESKTTPSYLFAPALLQSVPEGAADLTLMQQPEFDPFQTAFLNRSPPLDFIHLPSDPPANLKYLLLKDNPDDQVFKIRLDRKNLVVFSEVFFPGWKAWVDGQPSELLIADHALRSLFLPAGTHEVEFRYQPFWFKPIITGMGLWLSSLLAYGWFRMKQKPPRGMPI